MFKNKRPEFSKREQRDFTAPPSPRESPALCFTKKKMIKKISLQSLGCRANQAEIEELKQALLNNGLVFVGPRKKADIYVINCCSVTAGAERDTRRAFNKIKKQNPQAKIYALGCLLNKKQPNIDGYFKNWGSFLNSIKLEKSAGAIHELSLQNKTKYFIKIQDGCTFECAYCVTRLLRGKNKSKSPTEIIKLIKQKEKDGRKEIVLTGINILLYNHRGTTFANLIKKILRETSAPRIRFGSLDPRLINNQVIGLWKNQRLLPHLHLSAQSGSDRILENMNRDFPAEKISQQIKKFRAIRPNFSFSCDIIVGFPGETEGDFEKSLKFARQNQFFKIHAFPYSDRPGTSAEKLPDKITEKEKNKRMEKILKLDKELRKKFQQKMLGKKVSVLWEGRKNNFWVGRTENFLKIKKKSDQNLKNKVENVKLTKENLVDY